MLARRSPREFAFTPPLNGSAAPTPPPSLFYLLLETTVDFLLLEDGSKLLLE